MHCENNLDAYFSKEVHEIFEMILEVILLFFQIPLGILNHKLFRRLFPSRVDLHNPFISEFKANTYLKISAVLSVANIFAISALSGLLQSLFVNLLSNYIGWSLSAVGLTGGMGSGKSTASTYIQDILKIHVVDADRIARNVVKKGSPAFHAILNRFGTSFIDPVSGELDRLKLGRLVFNDREKRAVLERITHPRIMLEIIKQLLLGRLKRKKVVLDAPLLFEDINPPLLYLFCCECICLDATYDNQKTRISLRNPELSPTDIENRIHSQLPRDRRVRMADYIINNNGTPDELFKQLRQFFRA
jgi:dephospho-CoA kinase